MADALAQIPHLEKAWRALTAAEQPRAEYYLGFASRLIRRRWKDVDERISAGTLDAEDVQDVVVHMVLGIIDGAPVRRAKSWSETRGPLSQSVTLESGKTDLITIEDWMIEVFLTAQTGGPAGSFPPSGRYENIFHWPEGRY
ncbi:Gp19/Gp15/Gp42 family protein [Arthrobacter sp. MP_2.3]|uniref:Gp19/Gp15/Gp42 family protein n=1 Tax=Arthrobacter sp. MP_2.3 TaxID=3349633 RepID=UPI0038D50FA3